MATNIEKIYENMYYRGSIEFPKKLGCVDPTIEWEKWLSYQPEREIKRRQEIKDKDISLTLDDLKELKKYKDRVVTARLFKKYNDGECSFNEYQKLSIFMENSIEEYMLNVLTEEELKEAKEKIKELNNISQSELKRKVKEEQKLENYNELSMVDAYVLHIISAINYNNEMENLNKSIDVALMSNKIMTKKMNTAS